MDESRKKFEEWFEIKSAEYRINGIGMIHIARLRDKAWESWQASRESLRKEMEVDEWDLK